MLLWILFAGMSGAALAAVLWPLLRRGRAGMAGGGSDTEVYRDQLKALDEEVSRGVINPAEADSARTEISRRLLAASERSGEASAPALSPITVRRAGMAMALAALVIALGGYLIFGSPQLPGQPLAARQAKPLETQDAQLLLAKIEAHLQKNPEDGKGWDVVAPFYLKVRRYDSAVRAYSNAIRILGESATRLSGLGEALTQANDGLVTAEARESFEKAANMSPDMIHPRFYLALALEQDGKLAEAADAWHKLLLAGPESAPWRALAEHRLAALRKTLADRPGEPGPSAEDVRQAEDMSAEDRAGMIENMVAGLAARLKEDGNDLAGWLRLIRAYGVLGRKDDLSRAIGDAREQFSQNPDALAQIDAAATQAGAPVTKP